MEAFISFFAILFFLYILGYFLFPFFIFTLSVIISILNIMLYILVACSKFLYGENEQTN